MITAAAQFLESRSEVLMASHGRMLSVDPVGVRVPSVSSYA